MPSPFIKILIVFILIAIFFGGILYFNLHNLFIRHGGIILGEIKWEDKGPTPLGEKGFTPQGLTWVNGKIIFSNSWKNTRSRVYQINPENMEIQRYFDMPAGAFHTSGLAWDGKYLWAVDYCSNNAYCLDLETSLTLGQPKVIGTFNTTLKGTSACCILRDNKNLYLVISDYRRTKKTIFVRMYDAIQTRTAAGHIDFEYRNEGFSQGLEYANGYIYESENKWGLDVINKIDLFKLRLTKDARNATIKQYPAPNGAVEDLAWDGSCMWTSDEKTFRFYKGVLK